MVPTPLFIAMIKLRYTVGNPVGSAFQVLSSTGFTVETEVDTGPTFGVAGVFRLPGIANERRVELVVLSSSFLALTGGAVGPDFDPVVVGWTAYIQPTAEATGNPALDGIPSDRLVVLVDKQGAADGKQSDAGFLVVRNGFAQAD